MLPFASFMSDKHRPQTTGEELANCLSHAAGLLLAAFAGLPMLVTGALRHNDTWQLVGGTVFGASLVTLYAASTLYHLLPAGRPKQWCRLMDHSAIFLLIAGTYTPFALGALRGPWGWSLLVAVWTLAIVGITLKFRVGFRYPKLSTAVYLLMGWLVLTVLRPLVAQIGPAGFGWLLAGGLSYSLGVIFFVADRRRYAHVLWHVFVLMGSLCHFVAVFGYAARVG